MRRFYTLSLHDALPIWWREAPGEGRKTQCTCRFPPPSNCSSVFAPFQLLEKSSAPDLLQAVMASVSFSPGSPLSDIDSSTVALGSKTPPPNSRTVAFATTVTRPVDGIPANEVGLLLFTSQV